jgi:hypothetical protein
MAFVYNNDLVESFAEFQDILDHDQRLFDTNEGLSESVIYPYLIRSTSRILSKIKGSDWWKSVTPQFTNISPELIITRHDDFTELCVYTALFDYILPIIANFGTQDNAEIQKMNYYQNKADALFEELINLGDWYDFNADNNISNDEIKPGTVLRRRIR